MDKLFFDSAESLLRIAITVPILYVAVIAFIRLSGKRSTSQMNNFDWIVTVAMGSLVASGIVLKDVSVSDVAVAIGLLLIAQYLLTNAIFHSGRVTGLVKAEPRLLLRDGECLFDAMADERVTEDEILSAIRNQGIDRIEDVAAVILETDATFSVIPVSGSVEATALKNIAGPPAGR